MILFYFIYKRKVIYINYLNIYITLFAKEFLIKKTFIALFTKQFLEQFLLNKEIIG